ncbi:Methyltransferase domain 25 [Sergentomyia squamirostris]
MSYIGGFVPEFYEKSISFRSILAQRCIQQLGYLVQWKQSGGDSVVDIGCGAGDTTKECFYPLIPRTYSRLVCLDISAEMLEAAKENFSQVPRVDFFQLDIGSPISEVKKKELGSFDHIFSSFCLSYVKDQKQAFKNIFDMLNSGGDILMALHAITPPIEILFRMAESPRWKDKFVKINDFYPYPYRKDTNPQKTLEELLKSSGFTDVNVTKNDSYETFKSVEFLRDFMMGLPLCDMVSEEEKAEFYEDQVKIGLEMNVVAEHINGEPPLRRILHIYARKPI